MKTLNIKIAGNYELGEHATILYAAYMEIDKDKTIYIFDVNDKPTEHYVTFVSAIITHPYVMIDSRTDNLTMFINLFKNKLLEGGYCEENEAGTLFALDIEDNERIRIGKRVAELRKEKGLSQNQLANATGTHQGHIARLEAGRYNVGFDTLQAIAGALGANVDFVK